MSPGCPHLHTRASADPSYATVFLLFVVLVAVGSAPLFWPDGAHLGMFF